MSSGYLWLAFEQERLADDALAALRTTWTARSLAGPVRLAISPPWALAEVLRGQDPYGPRLRAIVLEPEDQRGRLLRDDALEGLRHAPGGPVARGARPWPGDPVARRLSRLAGAILSLGWQDPVPGSPGLAYAALFREGRCRWSVQLEEGSRLARWDGDGLREILEPRRFPEGDRAGVWRAGVGRLLGRLEALDAEDEVRLVELLEETVCWPGARSVPFAG